MSFTAGCKVVCVDDTNQPCFMSRHVQLGTVYVLARVYTGWTEKVAGKPIAACDVVGLSPIDTRDGLAMCYELYRFRLLAEAGHPAVATAEAATAAPAAKYGRTQFAAGSADFAAVEGGK